MSGTLRKPPKIKNFCLSTFLGLYQRNYIISIVYFNKKYNIKWKSTNSTIFFCKGFPIKAKNLKFVYTFVDIMDDTFLASLYSVFCA